MKLIGVILIFVIFPSAQAKEKTKNPWKTAAPPSRRLTNAPVSITKIITTENGMMNELAFRVVNNTKEAQEGIGVAVKIFNASGEVTSQIGGIRNIEWFRFKVPLQPGQQTRTNGFLRKHFLPYQKAYITDFQWGTHYVGP